jgi:hypothetical protein
MMHAAPAGKFAQPLAIGREVTTEQPRRGEELLEPQE